jgi:hypothetical protein
MAEVCVRDLSPLLSILATDPLNRLLRVAMDRGLLSPLNGRTTRFRISMYADDAVIFLKPSIDDVNNLVQLWFGDRTANKYAKDDGLNNQLR